MDFVPTRASLLKGNENIGYEVTTFEDRKTSTKLKHVQNSTKMKLEEMQYKKEFNIKSAKNEIVKLAIDGFDPVQKENLRIQRAIKLGAKPPRNKYQNYKELKMERQKEQKITAAQITFQQLGKNSAGMSTAKGKSFDRKRRQAGILNAYGKVKKSQVPKINNVKKKK